MKIESKNGVVTATAETIEDIQTLLGFKSTKEVATKTRKYKKQMRKTCMECGKDFKGSVGLGIHLAKAHGVPSPLSHLPITAG